MDSAFRSAIPDLSLAASVQLSENSRLGFATKKTGLHQGIEWSKSTLALGLPEWSGKIASGPAVAANNGPCGGADCTAVQRSMLQMVWKPPLAALRQAAKGYLCGSSPANNIRNWTIEGGAKGTAVGAIAGGVTGTVLGTPVGGFFGAILGGLIDGTVTAGGGVFGGSAASVVCSSLGVYSGS